jgi:hypothetical protein
MPLTIFHIGSVLGGVAGVVLGLMVGLQHGGLSLAIAGVIVGLVTGVCYGTLILPLAIVMTFSRFGEIYWWIGFAGAIAVMEFAGELSLTERMIIFITTMPVVTIVVTLIGTGCSRLISKLLKKNFD